jgi:glycosyltransferase involved in cell wall biosynthesis
MPRAVFLCHQDRHLYQFRLALMRALAERGWEIAALCPPGPYADRFAVEGIRHVSYGLERGSLNPLKESVAIVEAARRIGALEPDLIHTFTIKANIYGAWGAAWAGVPKRVATVSGLGSFYTGAEPPTLLRRGLDLLYASALKRVDRVIFENRDDRDELTKLGICPPGRAVIIPGAGVDTSRFAPGPTRAGEEPVVVTMAARLIRDKGVAEFLSAAETLKAKWGENAIFQLAGEADPGNLWAADASRLASCAKRGIVRLLGFVEDVPGLLRGTDIYVLPSYREGTPVSVLEAMSAGLPVVTTDAIGCRETVIPEVSGLRVPVKDSAALAAALDRLIAEPALRLRLGRAARIRAEEVFADKHIVAAHLAVYRELLPALFRGI